MKTIKYITYVLITLFVIACSKDDGYVYKSLYNLEFTNTQPIVAEVGVATQAQFNISKVSGKDNFYEFTIDETADFTDFSINGISFAANEFVKINDFKQGNIIAFTPLSSGDLKLPVKIRYCGLELPYVLEITTTGGGTNPTPGLILDVTKIKITDADTGTSTDLADRYNKDEYEPGFKFDLGNITLTDNMPDKTWELTISSALDNIEKITYKGKDYLPGDYFEFDPADADQLVIVPKANATYGDETFTFKAKNSDGTESNEVEIPFRYYADITTNISTPLDSEGYYTNPGAYFELRLEGTNLDGNPFNPALGGNVDQQFLKVIQDVSFNGNGAKIKNVYLTFSLDDISTDPAVELVPRTKNEYFLEDGSVSSFDLTSAVSKFEILLEFDGDDYPAYYAYNKQNMKYEAFITLNVENEFGDVFEISFRDVKEITNPRAYKFTY